MEEKEVVFLLPPIITPEDLMEAVLVEFLDLCLEAVVVAELLIFA